MLVPSCKQLVPNLFRRPGSKASCHKLANKLNCLSFWNNLCVFTCVEVGNVLIQVEIIHMSKFKLGKSNLRAFAMRLQCSTCVRVPFELKHVQKSLIIHEQNTKEIIAVKESLYVIKHTCISKSIFSAYTTSILKIRTQRK